MNKLNSSYETGQYSKNLIDMWIWGESPLGEEFDDSWYIDFSVKNEDSSRVKNDGDDLLKKWIEDPQNTKFPFLLQIKGVVGSGKTTTVKYFREIINNVDDKLFKSGYDNRIFHFPINISENRSQFRKKAFLSHCLSQMIENLQKKLYWFLKIILTKHNKLNFLTKELDFEDIEEDLELFLAENGIDPPQQTARILYFFGIERSKESTTTSLFNRIEEIKTYFTSAKKIQEIFDVILNFFAIFREDVEIPILIFSIDNWDLIEQFFYSEVFRAFNDLYNLCQRKEIPFALIMGASDEFYEQIKGKIDPNNKLFTYFLYPGEYEDNYLAYYRAHIILPDKLMENHATCIIITIEVIFRNFEIYYSSFSQSKLLEYKEIVKKLTQNIYGSLKINELFSIISNLVQQAIEKNQPANLFEIDYKVYLELLKIRARRRALNIEDDIVWNGFLCFERIIGYKIINQIENEAILEDKKGSKIKVLYLNGLTGQDFDKIRIHKQHFVENFHLVIRSSETKISQQINISKTFQKKIFNEGLPPLRITSLNEEQIIMFDLLPELDSFIRNMDDPKIERRYRKLITEYIQL